MHFLARVSKSVHLVLVLFVWNVISSVVPGKGLSLENTANTSSSSDRSLVINLGIAKTGTSSLKTYFECSGWRAVHNLGCNGKRCFSAVRSFLDDVPYNAGRKGFSAEAARAATARFRAQTGNYDAYTEFNDAFKCIFPQVTELHLLMRALPGACWVLTTRSTEQWLASVKGYTAFRMNLLEHLLRFCPLPPELRNETGLAMWYEAHVASAKAALANHSCALVLDIKSPTAGAQLAAAFNGTQASCWSKQNAARSTTGSPIAS